MCFDDFQPLGREEARSLITSYLVEYVSRSHSVKVSFVAGSRSWLNISGLSSDEEYTLMLRAVSRVGANSTLHVSPVHIPKHGTSM